MKYAILTRSSPGIWGNAGITEAEPATPQLIDFAMDFTVLPFLYVAGFRKSRGAGFNVAATGPLPPPSFPWQTAHP